VLFPRALLITSLPALLPMTQILSFEPAKYFQIAIAFIVGRKKAAPGVGAACMTVNLESTHQSGGGGGPPEKMKLTK
jgi:hypothetical protein